MRITNEADHADSPREQDQDQRYRVGNHQPQNIYRGDSYIGVMFDPQDAALVVATLNERVEG